MSLQKPNDPSVLPAVGGRSLRTNFRDDGTAVVNCTAQSNDGKLHEASFENATAAAWITNAFNNPGTSAQIDALKIAYPNWTPADMPPSVAALLIYADTQALGFAETP